MSSTPGERAFFTVLRLLALAGAAGMFAVIGFAIVALLKPDDSTRVTYTDVVRAQRDNADTTVEAVAGGQLRIPPEIHRYFDRKKNSQTLAQWVEGVPKDQQQPLLDELADVIRGAEANAPKVSLDSVERGKSKAEAFVYDALNKYRELKTAKLAASPFAPYVRLARRITLFATIGSALGLFATFTIVLVLLAIERNTRRSMV